MKPGKHQRSNKDTKICLLEGPPPCTIVDKTFLLVIFSQSVVNNNYCVLCTIKAKKANKNIQQRSKL